MRIAIFNNSYILFFFLFLIQFGFINEANSQCSLVASTTNEFCNRADGTATVAASGGSGIYTYLWMPTGQTTATATGLVAGNYSITITDGSSCIIDTVLTVNFTTGPLANAGADISLCSGNSVSLSGSGGGSYTWSPSAGLSNSAISNPVFSGTASTTYTLLVTDVNNCTASDDISVTVHPTPEVSSTATAACFNNPTIFNNTSIGVVSQWTWHFGDGNTSALQNPTHTYNNSGTFTVTLVAETAQGCKDSTFLPVTVYPLPVTSFSSTTVCIGSATAFTDLSTVSSGNVIAWSWNFGDPASGLNNTSNLQNPTHVFTAVGNFNVLLTVTSSNNCQNVANKQAVVLFPPVAAFTAKDTCLNAATNFTDQSSNTLNWFWNFGDGGTSTTQHPTHTYLTPGSYVVTLIASSTGTCIDTITDTITIYSPPIAKGIADTVCQGEPTNFFNLSFIPNGTITNWLWDFGDGNTSSLVNPTHIYSSAGSYTATLTVTSSYGCVGTTTVPILVFSLPNADFSFSPSPTAQLIDEIFFTDQSTGAPVSWFWNFGDGDTSTLQNPAHFFSDTGAFVVTLIIESANGCFDTIQHKVEIRDFAFYIPNSFSPNGDDINELFFGKGVGIIEYEMSIFDRWGNQVFYCKINDLPQTFPCMWDGKVEAGRSNRLAQEDVYVWKVKLINIFHTEYNYIGNLSLIR